MTLPKLFSVKVLVTILTLLAIGLAGYAYFQANGKNLSWCALNINACRIARIQALERDLTVLKK